MTKRRRNPERKSTGQRSALAILDKPKRELIGISLRLGLISLSLHPAACHRDDLRRHLIGLTGVNALQVAWCDPARWIVSRGKLTDSSARLADPV